MRRPHQILGPVGVLLGLTPFVFLLVECGTNPAATPMQTPEPQVAVIYSTEIPTFDFGSVTVNVGVDKTFTLTNDGVLPATDVTGDFSTSTAFAFKGGAYPGTGGDCGATLAVGASCNVVVTFKPTYVSDFQTILSISYYDGEKTRVTKASAETPNLKGKGQ